MIEARLDGSETRKVKRAFIPNAAKMRPDMSDDKAEVWASSFVAALSDIPVNPLTKALGDAIHRVFAFPTELEAFVRQRAEEEWKLQLSCIEQLKKLDAFVHGYQRNLSLPSPDDTPLSEDELRDIVRTKDPSLRATLLSMGSKWIDPELLAAVKREEGIVDDDQV